jgi:hypothetical protein
MHSDTSDIHETDKLINPRDAESFSIYSEHEMINDFRAPIHRFQIHHHTRRSQKPRERWKYGDPRVVNAETQDKFPILFRAI